MDGRFKHGLQIHGRLLQSKEEKLLPKSVESEIIG